MGKKDVFICGIHAVQAVLDSNAEHVLEVWLQKGKQNIRTQNIQTQCEQLGINVHSVEKIFYSALLRN